jgi:hypothetical protein
MVRQGRVDDLSTRTAAGRADYESESCHAEERGEI